MNESKQRRIASNQNDSALNDSGWSLCDWAFYMFLLFLLVSIYKFFQDFSPNTVFPIKITTSF